MNICDNTFILSILKIIKLLFKSLMFIIPLILIILIIVDLIKYVTNPSSNKSVLEVSIKRFIAALIIFFVPTIVISVFNLFFGNTAVVACFKNANKEYIQNKILESKEEKRKQEKEATRKYEEQTKEIERKREEEIKQTTIDNETLTGKSLGLESSFNSYSDNKYSGLSGYYLYIPKDATENMPLIVVFPPNNISAKNSKSIFIEKSLDNVKAFIYIPLIPYNGERINWSKKHCASAVEKINDLIDKYKINKNKISLTASSSSGWYIYWTANTYRIFSAIVPISSGMNFDTIKTYSGWEYLKTLPMKGYGEKGGKYAGGRDCTKYGYVTWSADKRMSEIFEKLGKSNDYTYVPDLCHGEIGSYAFGIDNNNNNTSDLIEWMISQTKQ